MPPLLRRHLRWIAPALVLALAAVVRLWALGRPGTLVFDELFYVRDAISQLTYGYPTSWPDSDPDMSGSRATAFGETAAYAVHPPLGKWLIGLGVLIIGPENGWGWRIAVAVTGIASVAVTMRLGYLLSRSTFVSSVAGLLLAIDGVHITMSRVALLDGFLAFFVILGALFMWKDLDRPSAFVWRRPWLLAAGLSLGAATAVKWSGLYPLAFFLMLVVVWDLINRLRTGVPRPLARTAPGALASAIIALPAAGLAYLASWIGWILTPGGHGRSEGESWFAALVQYHGDMFGWHSTLTAEHPYDAHPLTWPLALNPTAMYEHRWEETIAGISALPNPLVTWAGVAALVALLILAIRRPADPIALAAVFVIVGYVSGWLPWVLTFSRSAVFQFYAVVLTPFAALALALILALLCSVPIRTPLGISQGLPLSTHNRTSRRIAVAVFLGVSILVTIWFFPIWSAAPVPEWFWRAHMWLPGWS